MVVLPFVPVTPIIRSSALGSPNEPRRDRCHRRPRVGDDELRDVEVELALDDERHGAGLDHGGAKSWPSAVLPRTQKNSVPGPARAAVEGDVGDLALGSRSPAIRAAPVRQRVA